MHCALELQPPAGGVTGGVAGGVAGDQGRLVRVAGDCWRRLECEEKQA